MTRDEAFKYFDKQFDGEEVWLEDITSFSFCKFIDMVFDEFEQQLSNIKHNYEMQEIVISDYKKRIEELENENENLSISLNNRVNYIAELEAPRSCIECEQCEHVGYDYGNLVCWHEKQRFTPVQNHFCCKYYEPNKDKQ